MNDDARDYIDLFSISWKERLLVLRKMKLKELCRIRRSCKIANAFVEKHSKKIRARKDCRLIICPNIFQSFRILDETVPKTTLEFKIIKDPAKGLQCANFKQIQIRFSTPSLHKLKTLLRPLQLKCSTLTLSCIRADDYPALEALQLVTSAGWIFDKVVVAKAKSSFLKYVPECCKQVCILNVEDEISDFQDLSRLEKVFLVPTLGLKKNRKFVSYLQGILTHGGGSLADLHLQVTPDEINLDFLEDVQGVRTVLEWSGHPLSPAAYLVNIEATNQVALVLLYRGYRIFFIPNCLDDKLSSFLAFPSSFKVSDLSRIFEQVGSCDLGSHGSTFSKFLEKVNNAKAVE